MKRVVIVGVGFGGLRAARALAGSGLDVVLLDKADHHLFTPLLYQVATATLDPGAVAIPVRDVIRRWPGVSFRQTEVRGTDLARRQVLTAEGPLDYDYLVMTAGAVRNYFGLENVRKLAFDLKRIDQAVNLRNHLLTVVERAVGETDPTVRASLLTFAVVGGGPTGIELAASLKELLRDFLPREYRPLRRLPSRILLIEASDHLLPDFSPRLQRYALRRLLRLGVEVRLNSAVAGAEPGLVLLGDGSKIACATLVWAAGVVAAPVADDLPGGRTRSGRIPVRPDLTAEGHPEVYVLGDMAYLKQGNRPLPMTAPVAVQQGRYAGRSIRRRERGVPVRPFRFLDMGAMAVVGRTTGVAGIFGLTFSGFAGWVVWFCFHLCYLIGWGNRLLVLSDWLETLLSARKVHRIVREQQRRRAGAAANPLAPLRPDGLP
jgi:NADH dehydrogenase